MTNAPERIWIEDEFGDGDLVQCTYGNWYVRNYAGYDVEYVRADIVQALTAERDSLLAGHRTLNIDGARLETRIEKLIAEREMAANWWKEAVELTQQARLQYSDEKARAERAEAERDRLQKALTDAGVYLDQGLDKMAFNIIRAALKGETP